MPPRQSGILRLERGGGFVFQEIMMFPIEEAELLVEDELDQDGELDLRA
jgi:hypothetical protein